MKLKLFAFSRISLMSVAFLPILAIATVYQVAQARVQVQTLSFSESVESNNQETNNRFDVTLSNTTVVSGNLDDTDVADLVQFVSGSQVNAIVVEFSPKADANLSLLVMKDSNHNGQIDAEDITVFTSRDRPAHFKNRDTILTSPDTHFLAQITKAPNTPGSSYSLSFTGLEQ